VGLARVVRILAYHSLALNPVPIRTDHLNSHQSPRVHENKNTAQVR
jgi:hypothetical protein